jgi:hypothetical protein
MRIRLRNPSTGIRRRSPDFHLPLRKGTSRAPVKNRMTGGIGSVIVILSSLYEGPQNVLCRHHKDHARYKPIYRIELRPGLPAKMRMFVNKEFDDKKNQERNIKTPKENLYIPRVVEEVASGLSIVDC